MGWQLGQVAISLRTPPALKTLPRADTLLFVEASAPAPLGSPRSMDLALRLRWLGCNCSLSQSGTRALQPPYGGGGLEGKAPRSAPPW